MAGLLELTRGADHPALGGKARHVSWLMAQEVPVPPTWVLPIGSDPTNVDLDALNLAESYAVRSSANVEDGTTSSFAGQFATVLEVSGSEAIRAAVIEVMESVNSRTAVAYSGEAHAAEPVDMAVMIQRFVDPIASGVAFSRNPITGLNEIMIEAVAGRGDLLVSEGHTPHRWIRRGDTWVEQPREAPGFDLPVSQIAATCSQLATAFGDPIDLEWVWDGNQVWWVQARPITGLTDIAIYSNRISREVMPGMIKPLVWSINVPMVNGAWVRLFSEVLGDHDIQAEDLAKSFAYRSYFNMGTVGRVFEYLGMPRDSLEMLLGLPGTGRPRFRPSTTTVKLMPRMVAATARMVRFDKRVNRELPRIDAEYRRLAAIDIGALSDDDILETVDALLDLGQRIAYLNIVTPLLANLHGSVFRRRLEKKNLDFAVVDAAANFRDELEKVDPNAQIAHLRAAFRDLPTQSQRDIEERGLGAAPNEFALALNSFLEEFGHFSDSGNDFSVAPWSERVDLIIKVIAGESRSPSGDRHQELLSGRRLRAAQARAGRYQLQREVVSYHYTYGYGLFRPYLLELGRRFVARQFLPTVEDIMLLTHDEVRSLVRGDAVPANDLVRKRRAEMVSLEGLEMPEVIFGDDFVPVAPGNSMASTLTGTPTSRGSHRGTIRVVHGLNDFDRVEPGDVLAIPFSDVGWTPLFARAGAVVAESGGVLSHSSIVAREYGIPCVVSVAGAMQLPDGASAVVNGYTGEVVVEA